ncbi:MarR family winged helix-turn-helix transcriptional regulator [Pseudonocardia alni]|uniref:MarR family winged helix-turn-helix transcriptional regulator n=1 Tax=Pseudonocardia alni TaxID=33907 RepID=UPI00280B0C94|nr:MarR family transcriptional regulator [Pseudonocardia alni]
MTGSTPGQTEFDQFRTASGELFTRMRQVRAALAQTCDPSLTLPQLHLVEELDSSGALSVGELAARAAVSSPTVTGMLTTLERNGIVDRRRSPHDQRRVEVTLTEHGRSILREQQHRLSTRQRQTFDRLSPTERRETVDTMRRLTELLGRLEPPSPHEHAPGPQP